MPLSHTFTLQTQVSILSEGIFGYGNGQSGLVPGCFIRMEEAMKDPKEWIEEIDEEVLKETGIHTAYHKVCGCMTLEDLFTTDAVYCAAHKCSLGFKRRKDTQAFMKSAMLSSYLLAEQVKSGKFKPGYYRERVIIERGKQRTIKPPKFESKVVQKVLCDYLIREIFETRMIETNYASIRGRGTDKMYGDVLKALECVQTNSKGYSEVIVMTDFKSFFPSISTELLRNLYRKYIRDERIINLIMSFSPDEFGLSLGNETSQVPASFFPSMIDHYFKDRLGIKHYFRYCDDVLFIAENQMQADELIELFLDLSGSLKLTVPPQKIKTVQFGETFSFCKERFVYSRKRKSYYRLINPAIPQNESRKLKAFKKKVEAGEMAKEEALAQYGGVKGMIQHRPNTRNAVERLDKRAAQI